MKFFLLHFNLFGEPNISVKYLLMLFCSFCSVLFQSMLGYLLLLYLVGKTGPKEIKEISQFRDDICDRTAGKVAILCIYIP